jgi:hypothetical protein
MTSVAISPKRVNYPWNDKTNESLYVRTSGQMRVSDFLCTNQGPKEYQPITEISNKLAK